MDPGQRRQETIRFAGAIEEWNDDGEQNTHAQVFWNLAREVPRDTGAPAAWRDREPHDESNLCYITIRARCCPQVGEDSAG
jgi:hypothetical protein